MLQLLLRIAATFSLAAALCGCAPRFVCPGHGGPPWWELKSDHFSLRTDAEPNRARSIVEKLEYLRSALLAVLSKPGDSAGKLNVIAFATKAEFSEFVGTDTTAGSFARNLEGGEGVILMPVDLEAGQHRVMAHELAHYLSFRIVGRQPKWFAEGLASYFETIGDPGDGSIAAGRNQLHYWRMLGEKPVSSREILEWHTVTNREVDFYAKSWLLFHYLVNTRPKELKAYLARLSRNEEPKTAWNAVFPGWSLGIAGATQKLDEELENYRLIADFNKRPMNGHARSSVTIRHLGSGEVHALRINNRTGWKEAELQAEIEEALSEDPGHVAALTVMAGRDRNNALSLARTAVKTHPDDPMAWRLLGSSLNGHGDFKEREEAFKKAIALAPLRPLLQTDLAITLSAQRKFGEALPHYRRALELAPASFQTVFYYALTLANVGRCTEANEAADRGMNILDGEGIDPDQRVQLRDKLMKAKSSCSARASKQEGGASREQRP